MTNVTLNGIKLEIPDWNGVRQIVGEVVEGDQYQLRELFASGYKVGYCIDVGAHIGCFSAMVRSLWPKSAILCFEPDRDCAAICERNVPGATVMTAAVRYDGKNTYFKSPSSGGGMIYDPTVNFNDAIPADYKASKVDTLRLDEFITSQVDLLKLDCEGSEFDILSYLPRPCCERVRRIVGEFHHPAGYSVIRSILKLRFPHLKPQLMSKDGPIGLFQAK